MNGGKAGRTPVVIIPALPISCQSIGPESLDTVGLGRQASLLKGTVPTRWTPETNPVGLRTPGVRPSS